MYEINIIDQTSRQYSFEIGDGLTLTADGVKYAITNDALHLEIFENLINLEKTFHLTRGERGSILFNGKRLIGVIFNQTDQ